MTVEKFGSSYQVAFCFSNQSEEVIFRLFFEKIKTKVGFINVKVFMSDDTSAFYNAWHGVMDLLCINFSVLGMLIKTGKTI